MRVLKSEGLVEEDTLGGGHAVPSAFTGYGWLKLKVNTPGYMLCIECLEGVGDIKPYVSKECVS